MKFTQKINEATCNPDGKSLDIRKFITLPAFAKKVMDEYAHKSGYEPQVFKDPVVR